MVKRLSESSQPAKLVSLSADDILGTPLTKSQSEMLARLKAKPDEETDYTDIPALTDDQLAGMVRGKFYRPPKKLVSVRLEPEVVAWLQGFGPGYLTRVNDILKGVMDQAKARKAV